jgi:hypothetical protein
VYSRGGLDAVEKRKVLYCRELNPGSTARSLSPHRLSYPESTSQNYCYCFIAPSGYVADGYSRSTRFVSRPGGRLCSESFLGFPQSSEVSG